MGRTAYTEPQCLYKGALYLYLYQLKRYVNAQIFYHVTPFRLLNSYRSFGEAYCRQGKAIQQEVDCLTPSMKEP